MTHLYPTLAWRLAGPAMLTWLFGGPATAATPPSEPTPEPVYGTVPVAPGGPVRLRYDPDLPPPVGYHLVTRPRRGLVIGGAIPFGIFYGISALEALSRTPDPETDMLAIPVFGPFLAVNAADTCEGVSEDGGGCRTRRDLKYIWYSFDGAGQVGGATLLVLGYAIQKHWYYRDDVKLAVVPSGDARGSTGLAVVGRF